MLKRFIMAALILAVMSGASWATTVNPDYRYTLYQDIMDNTYANYLYRLYGDDTGFNYQLREVSGNNTAGPQWFATVYENYYYNLYDVGDNTGNRSVYRRTMGGEIPEITISAVGNIIGGFNFMLLEEPQPYPGFVNVYDVYPDPMESLCLVIKNGSANFNIDFGNPYASHYPYWWHWSTFPGSRLWDNRARVNSINEPIAYQINTSSGLISQLGTDGNYTDRYTITISSDLNASGDVLSYHYDVRDLNDNLIYITSGDTFIDVNDNNKVVYTVDGINITGLNIYRPTGTVSIVNTKIYNAAGNLVYTLETEIEDNVRYIYVCDARSVTESVRIDGFDEYSFTFNPRTEQLVNPGEYYRANVRLTSSYGTTDYGSTLGYITFNQRADLQRGYTRYREDTTIPLVIANVYDGNASEVPLQFDMTVYDSDTTKTADHVINRVKFTWDAQENMPDQDFGTFFMIRPAGQAMPTYYLETQITNRTGTRYRLYRYDMLGRTTGFQEILPAHWKYDLPLSPTELQRETLPQYFHLDAHSQIAPGLVTVYDEEVYGTVNTAYDTYESFRLSEYDSPNPKDLRLNYRRVGGMDLIEGTEENLGGVRTREFIMHFADVVNNEDETDYELANLMGRPPVMTNASVSNVRAAAPSRGTASHDRSVYINANAIDAFRFRKPVPAGLVTLVTVSDDEVSQDNTTPTPTPTPSPEPDTPQPEDNTAASSIRASATRQVSADIPLQPLSIRMRIPRQNSLIVDHWTEFENAATSTALFNAFARYGTVWLRSDSTGEMDANLFTAINNKGASVGAGAADCVRAFLYDDELFLDFIVVLADSGSVRTGKTAFVEVFRDDGIPYVLIGDGNENGEWDMTFYISATGENPTPRDNNNNTPNSGNNTTTSPDVRPVVNNDSGGGGGGCNLGVLGLLGALVLARKIRIK